MPDAVVLGGSVHPFARYKDGSTPRDWTRRVVAQALADARISLADVDAMVFAMESDHLALQLSPGALLADEAGIIGIPVHRVEAGGASGAAAVRAAYAQVRAGLARCVLVIGVEHAASHLRGRDVAFLYGLSFDADIEGFAGVTAANLYALSMALHMQRYGTNEDDIAAVSVKNHGNAIGNPWAHLPMDISIDDVLRSPVVSTPYKRLDCSPLSDGAAALVIADARWAPATPGRPRVRIAGSGCANDHVRLGDRSEPHRFSAKSKAARAAYEAAGVRDPARSMDVAEVYDAFAGAELQAIEDLLLAAPGQAARELRAGRFSAGGSLPVNLSGGLIGQGGVPGATGIAQVVTLERILSGRYHRQPAGDGDFRWGVADAHGGIGTVCFVHVLERT